MVMTDLVVALSVILDLKEEWDTELQNVFI